MTKYVLMTQDACPLCERLKKMLAGPLRGEFDDQIEVVHLQQDEARFRDLTAKFDVRKTPTLIDPETGRRLINDQSIHDVKTFLQGAP